MQNAPIAEAGILVRCKINLKGVFINMDAISLFESGKKYYDQDDYDKSIGEFTEVLKIDPNHDNAKKLLALSYYYRGVKRFNDGELDKAIEDLTESIRFDPNNATAYGARGSILDQKNDHDGVIRDFTEVIRLEPTAMAYSARGNAYYYKGKNYLSDRENYFKYFDLSIKDREEAVKLDPTNEIFRKLLDLGYSEYKKRKSSFDYLGK